MRLAAFRASPYVGHPAVFETGQAHRIGTLDRYMAHKVRVFNSHWHLPKSKPLRIGLGLLLIGCGLLGFLPVLGFWMIPLGLLVLSVDLPTVRRWRRQLTVWWHRRSERNGAGDAVEPVDPGSKPKAE